MVHRAHNPLGSHEPSSGDGAARHGGRFNRVGQPALYASLDPKTAWMEAQQGFPFKPQPLTLVSYEVDCADIVSLFDPVSRLTLGVAESELAAPWEDERGKGRIPATWALVDRLTAQGVAGVIVRSFAPGCGPNDLNLVLWSWSDHLPHQVSVIDDQGRLKR